MKILSVGAELFHADGGTDMKKLRVGCRSFVKEPTKLLPNVVVLSSVV